MCDAAETQERTRSNDKVSATTKTPFLRVVSSEELFSKECKGAIETDARNTLTLLEKRPNRSWNVCEHLFYDAASPLWTYPLKALPPDQVQRIAICLDKLRRPATPRSPFEGSPLVGKRNVSFDIQDAMFAQQFEVTHASRVRRDSVLTPSPSVPYNVQNTACKTKQLSRKKTTSKSAIQKPVKVTHAVAAPNRMCASS